ncbi:ATP-binding protein [Aspergillus homomorphus CBS 101889]|uniref:P-loop containing nucleoside triphosphate hydrolase protein n=1 Tax=Aspergillus homomorphus (strain CBS 101889) TaxID=1450537 RepID=A0A395I304_ASPHC|nr:P-loop containing nucleoside triphosphate hydrolase protein [Aspergillus homomorphus CBS 101889]RAL14096.1 P-loop containing nucleoside triphosphate hydrolase protein [Aspergillus homomorphus CBS 101889]
MAPEDSRQPAARLFRRKSRDSPRRSIREEGDGELILPTDGSRAETEIGDHRGLNTAPRTPTHLRLGALPTANIISFGNEEDVKFPDYRQLIEYIDALEQENALLKSWIDPDSVHEGRPFFQIVHRIKKDDSVFFKPPIWIRRDANRYSLAGSSFSMKESTYLQQSSNLAFVVYKTYAPQTVDYPVEGDGNCFEPLPLPQPEAEAVFFASKEMRSAVKTHLDKQADFKHLFPSFDITEEIPSPYLFWYCFRSSYERVLQVLPSSQRALLKLFGDWVNANYEAEYNQVDDQITRGFISCHSMKYLVRPGDPLVSQAQNMPQAYQATSWASIKPNRGNNGGKDEDLFDKAWEVSAWSYEFDGVFHQKPVILVIKLDVTNPTEEVSLISLEVAPLEYANPELRAKLERRGKTYWACRKKKFISYSGSGDIDSLSNNSERFMIDFSTYRQLHSLDSKPPSATNRTEIPRERMNDDEPPTAPEIYLFPTRIVGFNLGRKKWINLDVDLIKEVEWNKKAFDNLVVDEKTKELVQALITNRLEAEQGTDMIDGKGNGLTILLHGGPGTGKTFTAESVAELAEKPLYRVTCGDIGTQPDKVEHYLESALHLGKIWDCVVLLDEADVFLQERTLADLQRNALVSVFLRVLEYYDGILILTSNRVGTFDEAFKSRIQVSLHYPNLTRAQRYKIWRNLFTRLKRLENPQIDFDDVECYLGELAEQTLNGREIRNAITTSRQLARFKGKNLSQADLQHVLDVSGRFDKYLCSLKEGFTDDDIARDSGLR